VHVVQTRVLWLDPIGLIPFWYVEPREAATQLLEEAVEYARWQAPTLQVSTSLHFMDPAAALVEEGRTAQLIVLGRNRWRRGPRWLHRSVSAQVERGARGRVVLVGPGNEVMV
jgi:nucleotide-binding universal stress UspA family protein